MSLIVVDIEADGPIPHKYSMVSFGSNCGTKLKQNILWRSSTNFR
jgi:hypothetical protein